MGNFKMCANSKAYEDRLSAPCRILGRRTMYIVLYTRLIVKDNDII